MCVYSPKTTTYANLCVHTRSQVSLVMQRAEARGQHLRYAAARTALWFLDDAFAHLEALLFPGAAMVGCHHVNMSSHL